MLVIDSLADLKKYLEARKLYATRQMEMTPNDHHAAGMNYAFDESLKAVESLINFTNQRKDEKV